VEGRSSTDLLTAESREADPLLLLRPPCSAAEHLVAAVAKKKKADSCLFSGSSSSQHSPRGGSSCCCRACGLRPLKRAEGFPLPAQGEGEEGLRPGLVASRTPAAAGWLREAVTTDETNQPGGDGVLLLDSWCVRARCAACCFSLLSSSSARSLSRSCSCDGEDRRRLCCGKAAWKGGAGPADPVAAGGVCCGEASLSIAESGVPRTG